MLKRTRLSLAISAAFGAGLVGLTPAVFAQGTTLERAEITGSSLRRTDAETALPVTVIKAEDLIRQGITTVEQAVRTIPQNQSAQGVAQGIGSNTAGASLIDLRGLGASTNSPGQRTLVLLNGLRLSAQLPWFAKNLVNRYWGYMMGRGLVMPLDDLRKTNPASIPELLTGLEKDFISHGFDQKHILRTIVNSRVYQLDSDAPPTSPAENQFYTYYNVRRLSAEQLLEAIDFATNTPDKFEGLPEGTRPIQLPDPEVTSYFLNTFGRPNRKVVGEATRNNETNVTQVLHLMNSNYLQQKLSAPTGRVATLIKLLPMAQTVPNIYYATLARPPSSEEYRQAMEFLTECETMDSKKKVLEDLLWTLLNSREFLFNH
jgi:hypothetical protein